MIADIISTKTSPTGGNTMRLLAIAAALGSMVEPSRRTSVRLLRDRSRVIELPAAEVCERMRREGGSVFPAHANTGDPNGPVEACPLMSSHAR